MPVNYKTIRRKVEHDKNPQPTKMHQNCTEGHVNNIPTMQLFIGISRNTQSKFNM